MAVLGEEAGQEGIGGHAGRLGDDADRQHVEAAGVIEGGDGPLAGELTEGAGELLVEHHDRLAQHERERQHYVLPDGRVEQRNARHPAQPGSPGPEPLQGEAAHRSPRQHPPCEAGG